jgi:hypothetical protein
MFGDLGFLENGIDEGAFYMFGKEVGAGEGLFRQPVCDPVPHTIKRAGG